MAGRARALGRLVSLGIKYGPPVYSGLRRGGEPAGRFARRAVGRRSARMMAFEHAAHLRDGAVLPVYDADTRVWVIFSGDRPVGTHPSVDTPFDVLLEHYDLSTRISPADVRAITLARRSRRGGGRARVTDGGAKNPADTEDGTADPADADGGTKSPTKAPTGTVRPPATPEAHHCDDNGGYGSGHPDGSRGRPSP